ncbi:peptidylprolyl isomerase [Sphingomonas parva]|uniref:Parvulin-like PPIase n=1 Tax=Sphingomonas parva TaxID=2555898 RepID=A0A4Y8ZXB0_9SPHN|nr:peptidylprolyl isomerase [Sphingomonas parva]TFI60147.1 peptidylprolyl isomerase [Sphingomonas parva]
MKLGTFHRAALTLAGTMAAAAALAQGGAPSAGVQTGLDIPQDARFLAKEDPSVRKATAIVNGTVITGTDIDHRMALIRIANNNEIPPEEEARLRAQVLRNLVDETLQIQAAEAQDMKVEQKDVDAYFARYAQQFRQTPQQFAAFLRSSGSSDTSVKRQIQGELAWQRLQRNKIEPFVNVAEEEVQAVIERLNASRGAQEYKVSEIFLSATPETAAEARANAMRIIEQLRQGASFRAYARQFSEASTAAVGGDLDWVRPEQLPEPIAANLKQMPVGTISEPIAIPGGFSIIYVEDSRQFLTSDPRDAVLSLKQMTLRFAEGTPRSQIEEKVQSLVRTSRSMGGCGGAEAAATSIGAEVVTNDQVPVRTLPAQMQQSLLNLSIGEATPPFGAVNDRISVLVLCGRDDPAPTREVSFDDVYARLTESRVNLRAMRYLRDLRRDAVVDYR